MHGIFPSIGTAEKLLNMRYENAINDTLILLEHSHVYTVGRNGNIKNLLVDESFLDQRSIKLFKITRGRYYVSWPRTISGLSDS